MKKAMSIALIVEKASADALLRSARNQVDSNAYEVFNSVVELNGRYSSTDASAIGIDRLIIFDSDTTLGTGNLLDTNLQILNMFLGKAEKIESIALVKKAREDRINQYRANVNHPHSLIIPLSDRLEASFHAVAQGHRRHLHRHAHHLSHPDLAAHQRRPHLQRRQRNPR